MRGKPRRLRRGGCHRCEKRCLVVLPQFARSSRGMTLVTGIAQTRPTACLPCTGHDVFLAGVESLILIPCAVTLVATGDGTDHIVSVGTAIPSIARQTSSPRPRRAATTNSKRRERASTAVTWIVERLLALSHAVVSTTLSSPAGVTIDEPQAGQDPSCGVVPRYP